MADSSGALTIEAIVKAMHALDHGASNEPRTLVLYERQMLMLGLSRDDVAAARKDGFVMKWGNRYILIDPRKAL